MRATPSTTTMVFWSMTSSVRVAMSNMAGDLEEQGQDLGHRDLVGALVVDRLADGADRLGEILDRVMAGHIAGLEMHLGHAAVVAGDEAEQDLRQEAPLLQAEPAHDAAIDGDEPALAVDEQVPRMHVGMEEAVADRMLQEGLDDIAGETGKIVAGRSQALDIGEAHALDPFVDQHLARRELPVRLRHAEIGIVPGVLGEFGQGGRLQPQIHLHRHRARQRLDDAGETQPPRLRRAALGQFRAEAHRREVAVGSGRGCPGAAP